MSSLRAKVIAQLPKSQHQRLRAYARLFDRVVGAPFASQRPGVACTLHVGRCGSTVIGNMLNQHPRLVWDDEIYNILQEFVRSGVAQYPDDWLGWTKDQFSKSGKSFYGFECKIGPSQDLALMGSTLEDYIQDCMDLGVTHFVLLTRKNLLRRAISSMLGLARGVRHLKPGEVAAKTTIALGVDPFKQGPEGALSLRDYLDDVTARYDTVRRIVPDTKLIEIEFETDIEPGPKAAYERIIEHIGLAPFDVEVRNSRVNPQPISELISNFDEVVAHLEGSPYSWMPHG